MDTFCLAPDIIGNALNFPQFSMLLSVLLSYENFIMLVDVLSIPRESLLARQI